MQSPNPPPLRRIPLGPEGCVRELGLRLRSDDMKPRVLGVPPEKLEDAVRIGEFGRGAHPDAADR